MGEKMGSLICALVLMIGVPTFAQVPPGPPEITGPQVIIFGREVTLTCSVSGGDPTPTVKWLRDNQVIDDSYSTVGGVTTNDYTFTASKDEHLEVFECQSENGVLQNPLSRTIFVEVNSPPNPPVLSGPTDVLSGTPTTWTCRSEGAYPQPTMQMRVGNNIFSSSQFSSVAPFDRVTQSYTMTGTLNWAPTMVNNGNTIFCDVFHSPTTGNTPQTVSLPLTVRSPLAVNAPNSLYTPKVGNPVTLQCVVTSGTATQIRWYKNDQLMSLVGNSRFSGATPSNPSLIINQVIMTDSGNYVCEASNANTFRNTTVITVSPRSTPSTPAITGPTQLTQGERGTWTCTSRGGYPEPRMGMRVGSSNFNNELSVQSVYDNSARTYTLTGTLNWQPNMGHNGQTVCCDVTHPETLSAPQTVCLPLTVLSPLAVNAPQTFYNPTEETTVTLTCVVTSGTATGIRWYKGGQRMTISGRFSGGTTAVPSLTISNVQISDGGSYICEATDGFSTPRTNTILVTVQEKPATEYIIITTVLDGYNKLVRPIDPVNNITHSLIPMEIFDFDTKKLVLQAMQCMTWNDPRLSWTRGQPRISLPASVIWIPDIVLYGQKYMPDFDTKVIVMKNGDVTYCPQGPLTATDCTEKAGEKYECTFKFLSWSYDKVMLDKYFPGFLVRPSIDMSVYREHHVYEIVSRCAARNELTYPCRAGTYPQLTYTFVLSRDRNFCINRNMNPTCN